MRASAVLTLGFAATLATAQGDLAGLLATVPELSSLLEFVKLAGLNSTLSTASNITIVAPTNEAFADVDPTIPEGLAIKNRNSTSVAALLANHVFNGLYPADVITEVPTFAQTLLTPAYQNEIQPFTDITGGQYNGLIVNGDTVQVLSGEFGVSNVIQADIKLGEGIIIHIIDRIVTFAAPPLLFAAREGYEAFSGAVEAADLGVSFGNTDPSGAEQSSTDLTIFIPQNQAFEAIGSVLAGADMETLGSVLRYHLIQDNIIFSPSIGNVSVPAEQGGELQFTVLDDSTIFVNNAKVVLANVILSNGVAHIIDNVLNPMNASTPTNFSAPASDRVAYASATPVDSLPFTSSVSFNSETATTASIPAIFTTAPLVNVNATMTAGVATGTVSGGNGYPTGVIQQTGAAVAAQALPTWQAVGVAVGGLLAVL